MSEQDEDDEDKQMSKDHDPTFAVMAIEMKKNSGGHGQGTTQRTNNKTTQEATLDDEKMDNKDYAMSQESSDKPVKLNTEGEE